MLALKVVELGYFVFMFDSHGKAIQGYVSEASMPASHESGRVPSAAMLRLPVCHSYEPFRPTLKVSPCPKALRFERRSPALGPTCAFDFCVMLKSNSRSMSLSIVASKRTSSVSHVAVVSRGVKVSCSCENTCMLLRPRMVASTLLWSNMSRRLKRKFLKRMRGLIGTLAPCQA